MSNVLGSTSAKNEFVYIYKLVDPRNNEPRYIGWTINLENRLKNHLFPSYLKRRTHKNNWIKFLLSLGLQPLIEIIEKVPLDNWKESEIKWIRSYRLEGYNLTNSTDGGEGMLGHVPSEETLKKMSDVQKGKHLSDETKEKLRITSSNRRHTEEEKRKISEGNKGKTYSQETLKRMSEAHKGWVPSDESRKKMSDSQLGRKHPEEVKSKISASNMGRMDGVGKKKGKNNKYCGVRKISQTTYEARIGYEGKSIVLGNFIFEEDAAKAYNDKAIELYGEKAKLNIIDENAEIPVIPKRNQDKLGKKPNIKTSSQYIGVSWDKRGSKWVSYISVNSKRKFLGYFKNEIDAAIIYNSAAILYYGESAILNNIEDFKNDRGT